MSVQPTCARPQDLPVKADLSRLRVRYRKDSRLAFLGHLDLISTVERCVRRSGLPFSIGNGFARRMRIQFSSALPTGTSSVCEYFDVRLTEEVDAREALERLRAATPGALAPSGASYVPGRLPALEAWLDRAAWEVTVECGGARADDLLEGIEAVRGEGSLTYLRGDRRRRRRARGRRGLRRRPGRRAARARDALVAHRGAAAPDPRRRRPRARRGGGGGGHAGASHRAVARGTWASCGASRTLWRRVSRTIILSKVASSGRGARCRLFPYGIRRSRQLLC